MIRIPADVLPAIESYLTQAPKGQSLEVAGIDAHGDDVQRLQSLGVCDGRTIEVLRSGDPLIVRVVGSRLGIARRLAAQVRVRHS